MARPPRPRGVSTDDRDNGALKALRAEIDRLDAEIQRLVNRRAECAQQIAKAKHGASGNFYRPEREAEVLRKAIARNQGPLSDDDVGRLFRHIMSACLALQAPLRVAFLGPEGTYTHAAALKHFGESIEAAPLPTLEEVFREVEAGGAHFGVVPIENSSEGAVTQALDLFVTSPLLICGEAELRVHHHLLAKGVARASVKKVAAHAQALAQCREWLDGNLPRATRVAVASNAEAARIAARTKGVAAIAGDMAAARYGLRKLATNIEDHPENTTRFLIVGTAHTQPSGDDKTSLLLSATHRPGALHELLAPLARRDISLTRVESRPSRAGLWQYVFFVDIEGHVKDENVAAAMDELRTRASVVKWLGSYPKAVL